MLKAYQVMGTIRGGNKRVWWGNARLALPTHTLTEGEQSMSSRQSVMNRQNRRTMKPLTLGASSAARAYVIHIDWTDAAVVRYCEPVDTTLTVSEACVRSDALVENRRIAYAVPAHEVLYFAKSATHPGYYYILRYNGTSFNCTCVSGTFHKACHHQADTQQFLFDFLVGERDRETCEAVKDAFDRLIATLFVAA